MKQNIQNQTLIHNFQENAITDKVHCFDKANLRLDGRLVVNMFLHSQCCTMDHQSAGSCTQFVVSTELTKFELQSRKREPPIDTKF